MDSRILKNKIKYEGKIFTSKYSGDFKVVEYINSRKVRVVFIATGYESTVPLTSVYEGKAKDLLHPRRHGVGYLGVGTYKAHLNGIATKHYMVWSNMLERCYDSNCWSRNPTYKGCTVVEEWHNFQNFAKWFEENYIEGYHLDKDIKVKGNKVYGPDTCMFVSKEDNAEKAHAKQYILVNPEGQTVTVFNLRKFCKDNCLDYSAMFRVLSGERNHHKGWKNCKRATLKANIV